MRKSEGEEERQKGKKEGQIQLYQWDSNPHLLLSGQVHYSGTSEQRPPLGTSLLAFVERLALVRRFCVKHPRFDVFLSILIIKSRINKQESEIYIYIYIYIYNSILRTRLEVIVQGALSH